jgi:hypothetical protein
LAVDREPFSAYITEKLSSHPNVEVVREEVTDIPDPIAVLATGPSHLGCAFRGPAAPFGRQFPLFLRCRGSGDPR